MSFANWGRNVLRGAVVNVYVRKTRVGNMAERLMRGGLAASDDDDSGSAGIDVRFAEMPRADAVPASDISPA